MTDEIQLRPIVGYEQAQAEGADFARAQFPRLADIHSARRAATRAAIAAHADHRPTYRIAFLHGWLAEYERLLNEPRGNA